MGIETLIALAVGAAVGGGISKASGGSFWKGAALGSVTGGIGVGVDRLAGGELTGHKPRPGSHDYVDPNSKTSQNPLTQQQAIDENSAARARAILAGGSNPQRLVASSGLTGSTSSGSSSARRRLLGG